TGTRARNAAVPIPRLHDPGAHGDADGARHFAGRRRAELLDVRPEQPGHESDQRARLRAQSGSKRSDPPRRNGHGRSGLGFRIRRRLVHSRRQRLRGYEQRAAGVSADDAVGRGIERNRDNLRFARCAALPLDRFVDGDYRARRLRVGCGRQGQAPRHRADRANHSAEDRLLMSTPRTRHTEVGRRASAPPAVQKGAGLLEVLIAIVIIAIGLLGLAGLQTVSLQLNQGALVRSQASNLAYDITERIRANWSDAAAYNIGIDDEPESSPATIAA